MMDRTKQFTRGLLCFCTALVLEMSHAAPLDVLASRTDVATARLCNKSPPSVVVLQHRAHSVRDLRSPSLVVLVVAFTNPILNGFPHPLQSVHQSIPALHPQLVHAPPLSVFLCQHNSVQLLHHFPHALHHTRYVFVAIAVVVQLSQHIAQQRHFALHFHSHHFPAPHIHRLHLVQSTPHSSHQHSLLLRTHSVSVPNPIHQHLHRTQQRTHLHSHRIPTPRTPCSATLTQHPIHLHTHRAPPSAQLCVQTPHRLHTRQFTRNTGVLFYSTHNAQLRTRLSQRLCGCMQPLRGILKRATLEHSSVRTHITETTTTECLPQLANTRCTQFLQTIPISHCFPLNHHHSLSRPPIPRHVRRRSLRIPKFIQNL
mmetsp:Transcript_2460/g.4325  ORF Transcript_2460/g.4325 Transcript_2460/m.4325 type:complete len:370 (-) Transcript_2460:588-1697(-)